MTFISDSPIYDNNNDRLGRNKFINSIKRVISKIDASNESFVVGISGKRGEGKTSVLKLLENEIKNDVEIFWFEPRLYNKDSDIHEKFFNEFANRLGIKSTSTLNIQKEKLMQYKISLSKDLTTQISPDKINNYIFEGLIFIGLGICTFRTDLLVNWVGKIIFGITVLYGLYNLLAKVYYQYSLGNFYSNRKSTEELKEKIHTSLKEYGKKIVIFIDDLDRLEDTQIKVILQIVKASANFPNVVYILSYDKEIVSNAINKIYGEGNDYLHKIIQLQTSLPKVGSGTIRCILIEQINNFIRNIQDFGRTFSIEKSKEKEFHTIFQSGLYQYFQNIRDIKRYLNILFCDFFTIQNGYESNEIDIVDFMAIEAIKLFQPSLYEFIYKSKLRFFGYHTGGSDFTKEIESYIEQSDFKQSKELIFRLFPHLKNSHFEYSRLLENRIFNEKSFENYFNLDVVTISKSMFYDLISKIIKNEDYGEIITKINTNGLGDDLLDLLEKHTRSLQVSNEQELDTFLKIVEFLIKNTCEIKQDTNKHGVFSSIFSTDLIISNMIYSGFSKLYKNKDLYLKGINKLLNNKVNFYHVIRYLNYYIFDLRSEKDAWKYEKEIAFLDSLGETNIEQFKNKCKNVLLGFIESKTLLEQKEARHLIWLGLKYEWITKDIVKSYIENEGQLAKMIDLYYRESTSQSLPLFGGDYDDEVHRELRFGLEGILEYTTLENIESYLNTHFDEHNNKHIILKKRVEGYNEGKIKDEQFYSRF